MPSNSDIDAFQAAVRQICSEAFTAASKPLQPFIEPPGLGELRRAATGVLELCQRLGVDETPLQDFLLSAHMLEQRWRRGESIVDVERAVLATIYALKRRAAAGEPADDAPAIALPTELTLTDAAAFAVTKRGGEPDYWKTTIARAIDKGAIQSNGFNRRKRRISTTSLTAWLSPQKRRDE